MTSKNSQNKLRNNVEKSVVKIEKSKKESPTILAQTIFLGTLGILFILPIIIGAYLGVWLDNKLHGYSIAWTINLILVGVFVGAVNVYLFIRD
ncbi:AtpZ/AtpI family protein [Legionella sp. 227]|uniref:AtpZ/AtpI family protein n=1 Tax=Legionella sp. 227 TaxID=3367288 RepID=UPI00370DDDB6